MREITLRKWHGRIGAVLALFFALQAASGLALKWRLARRYISGFPTDPFPLLSEGGLRLVHSGPQETGLVYNILLGFGLIWMAASGVTIYLRGKRRGTA